MTYLQRFYVAWCNRIYAKSQQLNGHIGIGGILFLLFFAWGLYMLLATHGKGSTSPFPKP